MVCLMEFQLHYSKLHTTWAILHIIAQLSLVPDISKESWVFSSSFHCRKFKHDHLSGRRKENIFSCPTVATEATVINKTTTKSILMKKIFRNEVVKFPYIFFEWKGMK